MAQNNIPIEGKRYIFMIDITNVGTTYDFVVCLTSNSYQRSANVIDASSKCGTYKFNGLKDRTITIDGQAVKSLAADSITEGELNDIFEADTPFAWLFGAEDPVEGEDWYTGTDAILSALTLTAAQEGAVTFNGTVQVNGVPERHRLETSS